MRFDNKHFESNVKTSMSTLDKLKEKLHLNGASKGLENVGTAAKNVNMSGLGSAVEAVSAKFSALQVMGVTALANITNSAVNAGKRMISALTIDPVKTGFSEYETKINSIQTILSNTASKGTTMEDVTRVINELNTYADKTIYNFAEMTRNIGTFTAAGVGLEESAAAIQGIANLAAASGSTSQQASTAMYQLSQAISTGTVRLMDWNSVVNAGMGGELFQEAIKDTAREYGVAVDDIIKKNGSFRDSLQDEWLTADILNTTLKKFTKDGAKEYAESMVKSGKYTQEQADALLASAQNMEDAATKVKTFTQLWDTLKEAAQSGWAQTWELIVGDFEEAREFFSGLSDTLGGIIGASAEARNKMLGGALGSKWDTFAKKINEAGIATEDFEKKLRETAKENGFAIDDLIKKHGSLAKAIQAGAIPTNLITKTLKKFAGISDDAGKSTEEMTDKLEYFQKVVDDVWRGDYGDGEARVKALTEAGYDYATVQDLVNKTVDGHRLTIEDLSDAQLENLGYTDDQIKAIRELAEEAEKTGTPINELIEDMSKPSGRQLLIESLNNVIQALIKSCGAVKQAWREVFWGDASEDEIIQRKSDMLYSLIEAIHKFTTYLTVNEERADKLKRTFKGVFALLDIILTLVGGPLKMAFKGILKLFGIMDIDILDITASVGDAIVAFRDWIDEHNIFAKAIEKIGPFLKNAVSGIKDWIAGIKDADNIPKYIIQGLVNGLKTGIMAVGEAVVEIGRTILETIKKILGIHSPSTEFFEIGKNIILGLVNGIADGLTLVWRAIKVVANGIIDYFREVDLGQVIVTGLFAAMLATIIKVANVIGNLVSPLAGLADMFEEVGDAVKMVGKGLKNFLNAKAFEVRSRAMLNMALAIAILAGSVYLLAKMDAGKLWATIGALAVLALVVTAMTLVVSKLGEFEKEGNGDKVKKSYKMVAALVSIAGTLLLVALALKLLSTIDLDKVPSVIITLAAAVGAIAAVLLIMGKVVESGSASQMDAARKILLKISITLLVMVGVIKLASMLKTEDVVKGVAVIALLGVLMAAIIKVSSKAGPNATKAGGMILMISFALLASLATIKLAALLEPAEVIKGIAVMGLLGVLFAALIKASSAAGNNALKAGAMILLMSGAFLSAVAAVKLASMLSADEITKGIVAVGLLGVLFTALIGISKLAGQNAMKAGVMLLGVAGAMLILTGALFIMSKIDPSRLAGATATMSVLLTLFTIMIHVSKTVQDAKGTIIAMGIVIAILAVSLMALTFIDAKKLFTSVAALTVVILAFSVMLASLKSIANNTGKLLAPIITLGVIVVALTGMIMLLSTVDAGKALPAALAISVLLLAMAESLNLIKSAKYVTNGVIGKLALMGLIVVEIGAILGIMSALNVEASIPTAVAIGILLLAMSESLALLKHVWTPSLTSIASLAVLGLVVIEIGVVLGLLNTLNIEPSLSTVASLSLLLISMSAALVIVSLAGLNAVGALAGIALLITFIGLVGTLIAGIGALMTKYPQLEEFLDKGIPVLEKIGYAIGSFFGNIIGGLLGGMTSGFVGIADNLSDFMTHLEPFLEGAKNIDAETMNGIRSLAEAVLLLTAADFLNSILAFGNSPIKDFAGDLPLLGEGLRDFADSLEDFSEDDATKVASAADAVSKMAEAAKNIPNEGGIAALFAGDNDIADFGAKLPEVGGYLSQFANSLVGFTEDKVKAVGCAADAIAKMAQAAQDIPNEGGIAALFAGDNSIASFGAQMPQVGTNLAQFAQNLGTFTSAQVATVSCAATAIAEMAKAGSEIDGQTGFGKWLFGDNSLSTFGAEMAETGGSLRLFANNLGTFTPAQVLSIGCAADAIVKMSEAGANINGQTGFGKWLFGDNSLSTYGAEMAATGANLRTFVNNLGTFDESTVATVGCAADAITTMAEAATHIDGQSGISKLFCGDNSLSAFGEDVAGTGKSLRTFADSLGTFTDAQVNTVKCGVDAINVLGNLSGSNLKDLGANLPKFGNKLTGIAKDISAFCKEMPGDKTVTPAVNNLTKLFDAISQISSSNSTAVKDFSESLKTLATNGVKSFVNEFKSSTSLDSAKQAGVKLMEYVIKGVDSKKKALQNAFKNGASDSVGTIKDKYQSFYNAGSYLVDGFCAGISENTYKAKAKAKAMAEAAAAAASAALKINSPSKVFAGIGSGVVEGFVKGIDDNANDSATAVGGMADVATKGFSDAIRQISDLLDGDMDLQPTIRPVLDLSAVESGAGSISSILNSRHQVGVLANVGAISSSMRNQNGESDELISAITKLRKDLGNLGNTTNIINGVTYDDGSNLNNAVATIVRAAKIERRR
jgi:tape measure domain-containing protein